MKKIVCGILLISILLSSLVAASAGNVSFSKTFTDDTSTYSLATGTKNDDEGYWYIKVSGPTSKHIFGARVWVGSTKGSTYRTWTSTLKKAKKYEYYSNAGATTSSRVTLKGKKDNTSTSTSNLKVSGTFCP